MARSARKPSRSLGDSPSRGIDVEISDTQGMVAIDRVAIANLVRRVLEGEQVARAQISLAIVDDATIRRINKGHLEHDWPTDVISFPLSEPGDPMLVADLVVSAEMAKVTAEDVGADPAAELSLYIVHGLLHLCGFDDESDEDRGRMRKREDAVLRREGLPNTFSLVERRTAPAGDGS